MEQATGLLRRATSLPFVRRQVAAEEANSRILVSASDDSSCAAGPGCPGCGKPLPADAPRGFCPACLLGLLDSEDADDAPNESEPPEASDQDSGGAGGGSLPAHIDRRFGDYDLIEEISRGGMGVVYKARQRSLDRLVAVKMILAGQFAGPRFVQRFRAEAAAAAILQHPNIVAVHEVGIHAGQHFFSMDYVEGRNLAQLVGNRPLAPAQAARYVRQVADAIQYAHHQGILHRDLKPSNVLIDSVTDQPRVTDFGLAKRLTDSQPSTLNPELTLTGQVLGSPNFMPPEQASPKHGKVGRQSDVYALGGILYFLLTARAPFHGESIEAIVAQVLDSDPVAPRLLNPAVPRDLETVCLKCLEKEPTRRYSTARALAEDLDRFLQGEPVRARSLGPVGRLWRWCRRRPALSTALILLHVVFGLGLAGILWQWRRAEQERAVAQENLYAADMLLTQQALESSNFGRARELLERWQPPTRRSPLATDHRPLITEHWPLITDNWPLLTRPPSDLRGWEWHYLWRLCHSDELATLGSHQSPVTALAFAPDGRRLATASLDGQIRLWDVAARRQIAIARHAPQVQSLAFSSDGRWLASGGHTSGARLWEGTMLAPDRTFESPADRVMTVSFAANDGQLLACGLEELTTYHLELQAPENRRPMDAGWNNAFSADGRWLAAGRLRGQVVLLSLTDGGVSHTLTGHTAGVFGVAFSPDNRWLASASADDTARVWEVETRREVAVLRGHRVTVNAVAFSADATQLATAAADQAIKLWNTSTWEERATLRGHSSEVQCVGFSPGGHLLASGSFGGDIKLWLAGPHPVETNHVVFASGARLRMIAPDLSRLGAILKDRRLLEWDLSGGLSVAYERTVVLPGGSIAAASGGQLRAMEAGNGVIRLWDESWQEIGSLQGTNAPVRSMTFSSDGRRLAVASTTHLLEIWDPLSRVLVGTRPRHPAKVSTGPCFSSDAAWLSVGYDDGLAELWRARDWRAVALRAAHMVHVSATAFAPDNRLLATAGRDGVVRLWKLPNLDPVASLAASVADIPCLAFSPDGWRLVVGTGEGTVKLFDLSTRRELLVLKGHADETICAVGFTPDGRSLISVSPRDVIFWRTGPWEKAPRAD